MPDRTAFLFPGRGSQKVGMGRALRQRGIQPDAVAGHSHGEYSALVAAGAMHFENGLRVVRRLVDQGITRFVEVGPGRVLTGLVRRTLPAAETTTYEQLL